MWLPGAQQVTGNDAGRMNGDGSRKLLLHSTEGSSIEGAIGAYRAHNSWPTLTVDCPARRVVQHLPLDVAARSLRNDPGGADETNRDGTILVQVELVGFAERPASIGGPDDLDWFGQEVVRPICDLTGVPLVSTVRWAPYPASYGEAAAQRLSVAAWDAYSGVLGHQNAPDNDHGDPGAIDIDRILTAARGGSFMAALDERYQREMYTDVSGDGRLKEVTILVRGLAGVDPIEGEDIAGGDVRQAFKTLVQGAVLDGLRPPDDRHPGRGVLRGVLVDVLNEALDARLGPADPAG